MDDYYLYSGASFFVKKIIEGCSEYSDYIYATLVMWNICLSLQKYSKQTIHHPLSADALEEGVFSP